MCRRKAPLTLMLLLICGSCAEPPDTLIQGGYDEQEMEAAMSQAREEMDSLIQELAAGNGSDFAVKVPIEDQGKVEYFWLTDVTYQDGIFAGLIGNDPGIVSNVSFGQDYSIARDEISDWMFMRNGKMHGNYTVRPLLATMSDEQAEQVRSMLADP